MTPNCIEENHISPTDLILRGRVGQLFTMKLCERIESKYLYISKLLVCEMDECPIKLRFRPSFDLQVKREIPRMLSAH